MQNPNQQGMNDPNRNASDMNQTARNAQANHFNLSNEEWQTLVDTPLKVSNAMLVASPSGLIGTVKEAMAIGQSLKTLQDQSSASPMVSALSQEIVGEFDKARSGGAKSISDMQREMKNPAVARESALTSSQQAMMVLRKATPQDAAAYKQFVFTMAQKVAEAGREGGFMGIGGKQISQNEQALLNDLLTVFQIQRPS